MVGKVNTKQELLQVLRKVPFEEFGVTRLGLFGSFARNEVRDNSDVDLLLDMRPEYKKLHNMVKLLQLLEQLTGRKIELVTRESLNPYIGKYILEEVEYVTIAA